MNRVETVLFGTDDEPHRGHVTQVHELGNTLGELKRLIDRVQWLLIAGVLVGVLNLVLTPRGGSGGATQHTSIISDGKSATEASATHRDYLTVGEVAKNEGVTDRAVLQWIEAGQIQPPPQKQGKSWIIPPGYRKTPNLSANFRSVPQPSPDCK